MEPTRTIPESAVWSLLLPPALQVLCHARQPPPVAPALARRGARVDVVTRCDLETWLQTAPQLPGRMRGLWEPDADLEYDLAILWDPANRHEVRVWLAALRGLPLPPREIALWTRNRWRGATAPEWIDCDHAVRRAGWRPAAADIGLPDADRVRQLVPWDAYMRTPLVRHARTHRAWKERLTKAAPARWLQPARLRRASLPGIAPAPSALECILDAAGNHWERIARVERLLVSPNGVAIAIVESQRGSRGVLKTAYRTGAEGRVARNAGALKFLADQAPKLGGWSGAAPELLAQGTAGAWSFTVEECVRGTPPQSWAPAAAAAVLSPAAAFLGALAAVGDRPQPLATDFLERTSGAAVRATCALLAPDHAGKLKDLWESLLDRVSGVVIPLVPRHGDFKLENILGEPGASTLRVLDWELWSPRGLPLLDAWHLIGSRRARGAGISLGETMCRWILPVDLDVDERQVLGALSSGLDARFVAAAPLLYWLDRLGPIAARGAWPSPGWERANVLRVLEVAQPALEVHA